MSATRWFGSLTAGVLLVALAAGGQPTASPKRDSAPVTRREAIRIAEREVIDPTGVRRVQLTRWWDGPVDGREPGKVWVVTFDCTTEFVFGPPDFKGSRVQRARSDVVVDARSGWVVGVWSRGVLEGCPPPDVR